MGCAVKEAGGRVSRRTFNTVHMYSFLCSNSYEMLSNVMSCWGVYMEPDYLKVLRIWIERLQYFFLHVLCEGICVCLLVCMWVYLCLHVCVCVEAWELFPLGFETRGLTEIWGLLLWLGWLASEPQGSFSFSQLGFGYSAQVTVPVWQGLHQLVHHLRPERLLIFLLPKL